MRPATSARRAPIAAALAFVAAASGCATIPSGPSTMALPGTGRSFEAFRADDDLCRRHASDRVDGRSASRAAQDSVAAGAIAGAAIGALAGAALGGSQGAGVGAGTGLLVGTAVGGGHAAESGWSVQRRYDNAYVQCMYARGHKVPVLAGSWPATVTSSAPARTVAPLPPGVPVPPPGLPPPPPPAGSAPPATPPAAAPPAAVPPAAAPRAVPPPPPGAPPPPPATWRSG